MSLTARSRAATPINSLPHILMVSNHWEAKKKNPAANVFVDRQVESLRRAGIKISTFDIGTSHSPIHVFTKWLELRRVVRRLQPDLVHAQYGSIVSFVGALAGPPLVISFCGNDLLTGASVPIFRAYIGFLLSNLAALRARKLICKSEELRQALWWRRGQAVVIPNGVDTDLFCPGSREVARQLLGWEQESQVVLFNAGGDPRRKGLDLAKESMGVVRKQLPRAQLCVISNVEPDVMPVYYQASDVLLSVSLREGSPNVVKEALACDLPVVSTPVGDVPERLAGVKASAVVPRDANAIGEALVKILETRQRSNGRQHIRDLDSDKVAKRVIKVYQSVIGAIHP